MPYRYDITFSFTTFNKKSEFTGRNCTTEIGSPKKLSESDYKNPGLLSALAQSVYAAKPKWNILDGSIQIERVKQLPDNPNTPSDK